MARVTLTHRELFALWHHAAHIARAPAYAIDRHDDGALYLHHHDDTVRRLTPDDEPPPTTRGDVHHD